MTQPWDPEANAILVRAVEISSPEEQKAFLDEACVGDEELRRRVDGLLSAHEQAGSFLQSVPEASAAVDGSPDSGMEIGPYKVLQEIGEGGFGVVYMAQQQRPVQRKVALKIIKPGMDTREVVARFEAEQQALALMDHPHIARVLDAGMTAAGRPYFAMELVKGVPITEFCDKNNMRLKERLELFVTICRAVQHAHQKGVIHRDIKPSNVMVTLHDGKPVPKVIDFGVAKAINQQLTEKTLFTKYGQMIGTPQYMSPEQAEMSGLDVDTRSDIYSLGVLLYELLTGTTPLSAERLRATGLAEMQRVICQEEPPTPSTRLSTLGEEATVVASLRQTDARRLRQILRGELDWIVMKTLDKDRGRRYETASALASDVEAYLNDEPVHARPPSVIYLLRKSYRRHRALAIMAAIVVLVLLVTTAISIWQAIGATRARALADLRFEQEQQARQAEEQATAMALAQQKIAVANERDARAREYVANALLIENSWEHANTKRLTSLLAEQRPDPGQPDFRDFEWYYWRNALNRSQQLPGLGAESVAVSRDGKWLVSVGKDADEQAKVVVWDLPAQEVRRRIVGFPYEVRTVAMHPNDQLAAICGGKHGEGGFVQVRDIHTGQALFEQAFKNKVRDVAFSDNGMYLAAGSSVLSGKWGELKVWNWESRTEVFTAEHEHKGFWSLDFSPDNEHLAVGVGPGGDTLARPKLTPPYVTADVCNVRTGETRSVPVGASFVYDIAYSPDGQQLAAAVGEWRYSPGYVMLWDASSDETRGASLRGHQERIEQFAFSGDGSRIATASVDRTVKIWDVEREQELFTLRGHAEPVYGVAYLPDGRRVVSAADDSLRIWDAESRQDADVLGKSGTTGCWAAAFSSDARVVAAGVGFNPSPGETGVARGLVRIWDRHTRQELHRLQSTDSPNWCVAFSPDDKYLAAGGGTIAHRPGHVRVWDWDQQQIIHEFNGHSAQVESVAFSPDGTLLVSTSGGWTIPGEVKVWDLETGQEHAVQLQRHTGHVYGAQFSPGGRYLAWGRLDVQKDETTVANNNVPSTRAEGSVILWDWANERVSFTLVGHTAAVLCLAFDATASRLASGGGDNAVKVWDLETRHATFTLTGHESKVEAVAFSPNGRRLVSVSRDGSLKLWDLTTGKEVLTMRDRTGIYDVAFSEDGRDIMVPRVDGTVTIYNATP